MGNVQAATVTAPPPTAVPPPPPPPPPGLGQIPNLGKPDQTAAGFPSPESDRLENPGTIEDLHKKCKDVFPAVFEGAKLMLNKGLSNHFQISHTINMTSLQTSGYRFGVTYVGTKQTTPTEAYPVLLGDIDPSGNLNANIIHQFGTRLKTKLATQVQKSKYTAVQMTGDYRGDTYTLSATLGNPDVLNGTGIFILHYLKSITPELALGAEFAYQRAPAKLGGDMKVWSAVGRYTHGDATITGTLGATSDVGPTSYHLCFHQKASQQLQVGAELEINPRLQECVATVGYQVDLPRGDLVFKGSADTNWTVGAVLEKKLQPLPFSFAFSGMMNHSKQQFRLGFGLIIG